MAKKTKKKAPAKTTSKKEPTVRITGKAFGVTFDAKGETAAEAAKEARKQAKEQQKAAIYKKVAKLTEMSKTTAGQAFALVKQWDESDEEATKLKDQISGLKGQIQQHKAEMRRLAREERSPGADTVMIGKSMAGLERDMERWEAKLVGLVEERTGHVETKKATMSELRKLIKDKAAGGLLFEGQGEQEPDPPAGKATKNGSEASAKKTSTSPENSPDTASPPPPSTSAASPAESTPQSPTVGKKYRLTEKETGERIDRIVKVVRINPNNQRVVIADAETGRSQKEIDPGAFAWDPA